MCADEDAEAAQDDANEDPQSLMLDNGGISFNDGIEVNEDEEFEDIVVQELLEYIKGIYYILHLYLVTYIALKRHNLGFRNPGYNHDVK